MSLETPESFEPRDVRPGRIAAVGVALLVGLGVIAFGLERGLAARDRALGAEALVVPVRVETSPAPGPARDDGVYPTARAVESAAASRLSTYAWDPARGVGRVPIERAMQLVVERGLR